jgi:DNA invertase Pin-like site-specific DNA recombinase
MESNNRKRACSGSRAGGGSKPGSCSRTSEMISAGCTKIYTHTSSNTLAQRKELAKALAMLRPGDTIVVWKLDRLRTSIKDLLSTMTLLYKQGIGFKSLTDNIDTTMSGGNQDTTPLLHYAPC